MSLLLACPQRRHEGQTYRCDLYPHFVHDSGGAIQIKAQKASAHAYASRSAKGSSQGGEDRGQKVDDPAEGLFVLFGHSC